MTMHRRLRRVRTLGVLSLLATTFTLPTWALPPSASDPVPDPGRGITHADDASATALNPANLLFLTGPELRLHAVWTGDRSPLPIRGGSLAAAVPLGPFATGLRLDLLVPPAGAPSPFFEPYHALRWALAFGNEELSLGHTFGWLSSSLAPLDGYVSMTTGMTWRPIPWLSAAFVARDWNEPSAKAGLAGQSPPSLERSWVWGLGGRPLGTRFLEAAWELSFYERSKVFGGRGMLALSVPHVGKLRGDLTMLPGSEQRFVAAAGLEVNVDRVQLAAGGLFGNALGASGAGFYASASLHTFRDPAGPPMPSKVVRITIDETPGVRGNTRLLRRLWRLADDPEVEGVVLQMRAEPANSLAHAEEVGDAVRLLRLRSKKVLCHLEDAGGKSLLVCAHANRIAMNPAGGLRFAGLGANYFYFGGLLQTFGVHADFVRIGAHKTAAEQLSLAAGTEVGRRDHQALVDQLYQGMLHAIGEGRHIPPDELHRRLSKGPFLAGEARAAGLVDTLAYPDEIERVAGEVMQRPVRLVDDRPVPRPPERWGKEAKIALIYLSGDMVDGESQFIPLLGLRMAGSYTIARALKHAREDTHVKSVVFRVETGGGSALAADVILREAILTAQAKPLIVSMGTSAASGGYYVSVAGREIFANRATATGSIGIFYGKADVSGLLDKFGVHVEPFRTAPRADTESLYRPFTDDERQALTVKVKQVYDRFVARVADGRHMTPDAVDAVGRGSVWTGEQALAHGLVSRLGGLREALAEARRLGRVADDAPLVEAPDDDESLLGYLLKTAGLSTALNAPAVALPPVLSPLAKRLAPLLVFDPNTPLARAELMEDTTPVSSKDP